MLILETRAGMARIFRNIYPIRIPDDYHYTEHAVEIEIIFILQVVVFYVDISHVLGIFFPG